MSFYPRPFRLSRVRDPTLAAFGGATFVAFSRLTDGKLICAFSAMKSGSSKIRQSRAKSTRVKQTKADSAKSLQNCKEDLKVLRLYIARYFDLNVNK